MLNKSLIRFAMVGGIGFMVDVIVLYLFKQIIGLYWARALSFTTAASTTWLLNRTFTFKQHLKSESNQVLSTRHEYIRYMLLMLIGGVVNYGIYIAVLFFLGSTSYQPALAVAIGSLGAMFLNYGTSYHWVFHLRSSSSQTDKDNN